VAEALGAWHATSLCRDLGLARVILEGDSSVVVDALNKEVPSCSSYGHIVEDTWPLFQNFHAVEVRHVRRVANRAAHVLAKFSLDPRQISQVVSLEQD
jgi:ribonuclease HI